jgi:hypothetical protein
MNPLKQLIDTGRTIRDLELALRDAKLAQVEAKKALLAICPAQVGDSVALDSGGYGEVYKIRIINKRYDYVSYGVDVSKDGESHFLTMVPSRAVMDRLRG